MKTPPTAKRALLCAGLALVAGSALTGCGNFKTGARFADATAYKGSGGGYVAGASNGGYPGDKDYDCTRSLSAQTTSGADKYTVCVGKTDAYSISLHGYPSRNKTQVCVFPVDVTGANSAYPAGSTRELYRCADMSAGYNILSFAGARFNGVMIVASGDEDDMSWCLLHANYQACPAFSFQRWTEYDTASPAANH